MKKRLSREEKLKQATVDIINKMFEIAGHPVTYEDIKDRKDAWYQEWTMTTEQKHTTSLSPLCMRGEEGNNKPHKISTSSLHEGL